MKAIVKPFDQVTIGGVGRGHHLRRVFRVAGEGFFHQHVLAIGERSRTPLQVRRGRQWHVDQVDVISRQEFLVGAEGQWDGMLCREIPGAPQVTRRDRDHLGAQHVVGRSDDAARGDPCRTQDADSYHGTAVSHDSRRCGTLSHQGSDREHM